MITVVKEVLPFEDASARQEVIKSFKQRVRSSKQNMDCQPKSKDK